MFSETRRIRREKKTIEVMIGMYCADHHDGKTDPCARCGELRDYAFARIDKCPFHFHKPTCANCPIHCYRTEMRERVRQVMRYAGPRMPLRHPWLALMHVLDGRRQVEWEPRRAKRPRSSEETV